MSLRAEVYNSLVTRWGQGDSRGKGGHLFQMVT